MKKMANNRPKWPELDQIFSKNQSMDEHTFLLSLRVVFNKVDFFSENIF